MPYHFRRGYSCRCGLGTITRVVTLGSQEGCSLFELSIRQSFCTFYVFRRQVNDNCFLWGLCVHVYFMYLTVGSCDNSPRECFQPPLVYNHVMCWILGHWIYTQSIRIYIHMYMYIVVRVIVSVCVCVCVCVCVSLQLRLLGEMRSYMYQWIPYPLQVRPRVGYISLLEQSSAMYMYFVKGIVAHTIWNRSDRKPQRVQGRSSQTILTGLHTTKYTAYHATFTSACMCITTLGRRFRENRAGRSSYCRTLIMQVSQLHLCMPTA